MRENKVLKALSYILLPIFIGILIISILYSFVKDSYSERKSEYFDTMEFGKEYIELLSNVARMTIYIDGDTYVEDNENRIYYIDLDIYSYNINLEDNYVLVKYGNKVLTNITNLTKVEDIKKYIEEQDGEKANIINGQLIATSLRRKFK